ncbi:MerR family transcriptional regulator [Nocardiopsis sp. CNT-189]|uniref:MerR family transcriptional regulator n=1 Tax=Nocardiopsis oceanisediminis TaxID=2816862 RepID=UPI003B388EF8
MDETGGAEPLMSIGAFARRVGLAPSALRFYDDCGMLHPARVDAGTGYRYYSAEQEPRAVLLRRLREAGMPLTGASAVLDGPREEARAVLEAHAARARDTAEAARAAVGEILRGLEGAAAARAVVGGAELAGAVRQVAPSAASGPDREEFPALGRVLIELDGEEVRLAATDRYRLAVRTLRPLSLDGPRRRILVGTEELTAAAAWAVRLPEVRIEADGQGARLLGGDLSHPLPASEEEFPDYRLVLDGLPAARHRIIADRSALRTALAEPGAADPVVLRTGGGRLTLAAPGREAAELPAVCTGPPLDIAFAVRTLLPAVDSAIGPDVLLEVSGPDAPVLVRSADQGSFTTLVMPVRQG